MSSPRCDLNLDPTRVAVTASLPTTGNSDQIQKPFDSYTNYLEKLLPEWPEYERLLKFLQQPEPDTETFLSVFDYSDDAGGCQDFRATDSDWAPSLSTCAVNVKLRVLLLSCQYGDCSRSMIDKIGSLYDIDPLFLWLHFDQAPSFKMIAKEDKLGSEYGPKPVFSTCSTPEIGFWPFDHTSFNVLESSILGNQIPKTGTSSIPKSKRNTLIRNIVLIILSEGQEKSQYALLFQRPSLRTRDSCRRKTSKDSSRHDVLRTELLSYDQKQTTMLIRHPLSVVLPFLKLYISDRSNHAAQDIRRCEEDCRLQSVRPGRSENLFPLYALTLKRHYDSFRRTIRSINATCISNSGERIWGSNIGSYLNDMRDITQQIELAQDNLARHYSICTSFATLQDSHKSIEYADSVGRLTSLAFFFIPLSFITSIFCMNLSEFGTGEVRFWVVVATAAGLLLFVLSVWFVSGWVSPYLRKIQASLDCFWTNYQHWKLLAQKTPRGGLWLGIFALTHTPYDYEWLLWVLSLRDSRNSEETRGTLDQTMQETLLQRFLSYFWQAKALNMLQELKGVGSERQAMPL